MASRSQTHSRPRAKAPPRPGATFGARANGADPPLLWSALVAACVFAAYVAMTPSVSGDKDSPEFALVLATNGVAHPTGYPLYTLLGHLFASLLHAMGASWPFAANAWSAVGGAIACFFAQRLLLALLDPSAVVSRRMRFAWSLVPLAWFGANPLWTYETCLAEVYSWHVAWGLALATSFTGSCFAARPEAAPHVVWRHAVRWGLLCALGLAHHATSLLLIVPCTLVLAVAWARSIRRAGVLVLAAAGGLVVAIGVPLAAYALLLRNATHGDAVVWPQFVPTFDGLRAHVAGSQYWALLGHFAPSPEQVGLLNRYLWPFLAPLAVGALFALVGDAPTRVRLARATMLACALAGAGHAFSYGVPDPSSYFLLPLALVTVLSSVALADRTASRPAGTVRRGVVAVATLCALPFVWTWAGVGRDRVQLFEQFDASVHRTWRDIPDMNAFVFWSNDMYLLLEEYRRFGGEQPQVTVVNALALTWPQARRQFEARYGLDPALGLERAMPNASADLPTRVQAAIDYIEHRVNAGSDRPVIHFDPSVPTVRLLRKHDTMAADSAR